MIRLTTVGETVVRRIVRGRIDVSTNDQGMTDLTATVADFLAQCEAGDGLVVAFVTHTTASLTIQENADRRVQHDLIDALIRLAPSDVSYRHHSEGPDDMPGHIKAMLSDTSVTIPVENGRPKLGTWQALYLIEHRTGRWDRSMALLYIGD